MREEKRKEEEARRKTEARNRILDDQYKDLLRKKEVELDAVEKEKMMLREKWAQDNARAKRMSFDFFWIFALNFF
jgi:hypothetical protein